MTGRLGRMRGKTMPDDGDFVWTVRVVTSFSQRPKCALLQNMCYDTSLRKQAAKGARKRPPSLYTVSEDVKVTKDSWQLVPFLYYYFFEKKSWYRFKNDH